MTTSAGCVAHRCAGRLIGGPPSMTKWSIGSSASLTLVESLKELDDHTWQMSSAEQAAIEGLLCRLRPRLAIEIGTAEGAGARCIAAHAEELHCFDLGAPSLELPDNVTMHVGDSHELLPQFLERMAAEGRNVDFVVVDGDHSASGVRRDIEDLLNSTAV